MRQRRCLVAWSIFCCMSRLAIIGQHGFPCCRLSVYGLERFAIVFHCLHLIRRNPRDSFLSEKAWFLSNKLLEWRLASVRSICCLATRHEVEAKERVGAGSTSLFVILRRRTVRGELEAKSSKEKGCARIFSKHTQNGVNHERRPDLECGNLSTAVKELLIRFPL